MWCIPVMIANEPIIGKVLDRPHGGDEIEDITPKGKRPYVRHGKRGSMSLEDLGSVLHGVERDVDSGGPRPLFGRPAQDLGVLRLVPQVRLEDPPSPDRREKLLVEQALAFEIIPRGSRPLERREGGRHGGPEGQIARVVLIGTCHRALSIRMRVRALERLTPARTAEIKAPTRPPLSPRARELRRTAPQ